MLNIYHLLIWVQDLQLNILASVDLGSLFRDLLSFFIKQWKSHTFDFLIWLPFHLASSIRDPRLRLLFIVFGGGGAAAAASLSKHLHFKIKFAITVHTLLGFTKLEPIAKLDETDLGHMKWLKKYQSHDVFLVGNDKLTIGRSLEVQVL
ncbi:hypothetical protein L6452_30917 [Arctium lappa]|uniref:Uncharacterized protein n=1 Tax=Arctium lappa TaxID=4217 RepID=A0ACB8ZJH5_ARCLA|nr:hypothetical protein L6452_30917 [Arctium lappa]